MPSLKDTALQLANEFGFAVFPLVARDKVPYKGSHGFKDATRDPDVISAMFAAHPDCNIAIATGAISGNIGVIDLDLAADGSYDGREALTEWQMEHGKFPETATVVTGRGGAHYYFRFPGYVPASYKNEAAHVDFRGEKGYAMLPGSIHPNGREVIWDIGPDELPIAMADENVLNFVNAHRPATASAHGPDGKRKPLEMTERLLEGARDDTIFRYACFERSKNVPKDVVLVAALAYNRQHCEPPLPESVVEQKVESAFKYEPGSAAQKEARSTSGVPTLSGASIWDNPYLEAKTDPSGAIVGYLAPTVPALDWWLEEDPALVGIRLETMSQQITMDGGVEWAHSAKLWRTVDDDYLYRRVQERYVYDGRAVVRSDKNLFKAFSVFTDRHSYDKLRDLLESLPPWDGSPRKDRLLIDCLGAEDNSYVVAVTALFLRAAIARALDPGCKYDHMVVLQGPQGIGKSTLLRLLAMDDALFVDDVKNIGTKDAQELIQGRWIVEMAELAAFKGKQVETLKSFITSQTDSYRVPYARRPVQLPRRCVMVGTTNLSEYLEDPTGNRRFLPVRCDGKGMRNIFERDMPDYVRQVWAEALMDYRNDPARGLILPRSVEQSANEMRERATTEDPWIGVVGAFLSTKGQHEPVCTLQVLVEAIGMDRKMVQKADNMRVSGIILKHFPEWKRCRSNRQVKPYGYQRAFERKTKEELDAERFGVQGCLPGV